MTDGMPGDWIDIRLPAFLVALRDAPGNQLILRVEEATGLGPPRMPSKIAEGETRDTFDEILVGARPIVPAAGDRVIEVVFDKPIAYCMLDESYATVRDNPAPPPAALYRPPHHYFLDYVRSNTWADDTYPGKLVEYHCVTLTHIVQIVSDMPPQMRVVSTVR